MSVRRRLKNVVRQINHTHSSRNSGANKRQPDRLDIFYVCLSVHLYDTGMLGLACLNMCTRSKGGTWRPCVCIKWLEFCIFAILLYMDLKTGCTSYCMNLVTRDLEHTSRIDRRTRMIKIDMKFHLSLPCRSRSASQVLSRRKYGLGLIFRRA